MMANIVMTGGTGANRTFLSIFGTREKQHDEVLKLEPSDDSASNAADSDVGAGALVLDEDDDAKWGDELQLDGGASTQDHCDLPGLQFAQRMSMEEWVDDDDEEELWKDALQDRVNQLQFAFHDDTGASESSVQLELQQQQQQPEQCPAQRASLSKSLPVSARFTFSGVNAEQPRHSSRYKMQRTSSSHACVTGETDAPSAASRPSHLWTFQLKAMAAATTNTSDQDLHKRSISIDFMSRNIHAIEHHRKRSGSLSGASSRTDSPRPPRKNSIEGNQSSTRSNRYIGGNHAGASSSDTSAGAVVFNLSDTEAIRRFVLDDVKNMSMERLVSDAQRLHFLENFYQNYRKSGSAPSVTSSTAVAPPSPASSSGLSTS